MPQTLAANAFTLDVPSLAHFVPAGSARDGVREQQNLSLCYNFLDFVSETKLAVRYFVSGMVQGVGYRYFAQDAAENLKISGFVRNLSDGRVEVFAMGTAGQHAQLRALLEKGPRFSNVREVRDEPAVMDAHYERGFVINPSA